MYNKEKYVCVGCGKDILSPHSLVWAGGDWCPLCEECSADELHGAETLIRCNKCHRILDRLMLPKNGCIMCMLDDISKVIRQINIAVLNKLNKVIEHNKNTKGEHND
jgi:DNA-directed RNA polymerase subunit RPC12/RpoP